MAKWKHIRVQQAEEGFVAKPHFDFQPLPDSERLTYEPINEENAVQLLEIFENDTSEFIDKRFKNKDLWAEYVDIQLYYSRFSAKHAGCDFFFKNKQGDYLGVLHFFDLSLEDWGDSLERAWIGFAVREDWRKQGYAEEAAKQLLVYAQNHFQRNLFYAETHPQNFASQNMLKKLGFVVERVSSINLIWHLKI